MEGKAGLNISQRCLEMSSSLGRARRLAQSPSFSMLRRVVVPQFCPMSLSFQFRLLPKVFQAGSSSESGHQATYCPEDR